MPSSNAEIEDLKSAANTYKMQCNFLRNSLLEKEKFIAEKEEEWIAREKNMQGTIAALKAEVKTFCQLNIELQESAIIKGKVIQSS